MTDPAFATPQIVALRRDDTHRLIPSRYREPSVLTRIADDDAHLAEIFDLDHATNDRLLAQNGRPPGAIGPDELLAGVPHHHIVNASFVHAHPLGSRFSGPDRGAWYAAFEIETAEAEIAFHKSVELAEIDRFSLDILYDDWLADFAAEFHDLRGNDQFAACLDPASYIASQALAAGLLEAGSAGIVYPSVRRAGGTCLACFRPALVGNIRRGLSRRFVWNGSPSPTIEPA